MQPPLPLWLGGNVSDTAPKRGKIIKYHINNLNYADVLFFVFLR